MADDLPPELEDIARWPAYAYLLGQYLGDGCISEHRRSVFRIRITCADSWPLVMEWVRASMHQILPENAICHVPKIGCTEISMYSKRWPALVPQHGSGRKHLRPIALTGWQEDVVIRAHPGPFVCGLLHSDGCRAVNKVTVRGKRYEYPRYFFSNRSEDIHSMFATAIEALSVASTRSGWNQSIARKPDVALLDRIGAGKATPLPTGVLVPGAGFEPA